jgi:hypothetical protein
MNETDTAMSTGAGSLQQSETGSPGPEVPEPSTERRQDMPLGPGDVQTNVRQQRTVPYGALAEERARRKELQRELQGAVETQQRLQGQLDVLHELVQQRAAGSLDESEPAPETHELRQEAYVEPPSAPEAEGSAEAEAAFRTQVMQSVRDGMRERPDFLAAYQHARQARIAELGALGYAPHEALEITFDNELEVIRNAYANGRNPALIIYDYAVRHGYRGDAPHERPGNPLRNGPGRAVMSEAEKVALAARGQAASKSLSMAGGGWTGTLTLDALASMSDEEFAEATKGDRWQRLFA